MFRGSLPAGVLQLSSVYEEVPSAAVAGNQSHTDFVVAWAGVPGMGSGILSFAPNIYSRLGRKTDQLQTTTIQYEYDPLYRMMEAAYSGVLSATYGYSFDATSTLLSMAEGCSRRHRCGTLGLRRRWLFSRSCPGGGWFCGGAADPGVGKTAFLGTCNLMSSSLIMLYCWQY
jgi:hypothetical protein